MSAQWPQSNRLQYDRLLLNNLDMVVVRLFIGEALITLAPKNDANASIRT